MSFQEDLAAAKEAPPRTLDVPLEVNGKKHLFRFTQMDGTEYATEVMRNPPDPSIVVDKAYGYNLSGVAHAVTPQCAVRVEGDEEIPLSEEEWADLFAVLDGGGHQEINNAIFTLNEYASAKAVKAAKKVLDGYLPSSS